MSAETEPDDQGRRERGWLYITACVILVGLVIAALITFRSVRESQEAAEKADDLTQALSAAGVRTPDRDQIIRVLGDDGGATCASPNEALSRAVLLSQLTNGAAGPGSRPVIVDRRVLRGQLLIIEIYCPDELDEFSDYVEDLKTDEVAG